MENDLVEKITHWFPWGDASEILEFLKKNRIFEFCEEIKAELDENIKNLDNQVDNLETENEELKDENEELQEYVKELEQKIEKLKKINKLRRAQYRNKTNYEVKNEK